MVNVMKDNYSIRTQFDEFHGIEVSEKIIKDNLDKVFKDGINGVFNFITLLNNENNRFIQAIFEDGMWSVEYSPRLKEIYSKNISDYIEVYKLFIDFYNNEEIDYKDFSRLKL